MKHSTSPNGTPSTPADPDRDANGRFNKGNRGGPGNPYARQTAQLLKVIREAVSAEEISAITRKLVQMAREGDVQAMKLLLSYVVGKPLQGGQPDQVDYEEWQLHLKSAMLPTETTFVVGGIPVEMANTMARAALAPIHEQRSRELAAALDAPPPVNNQTPGAAGENALLAGLIRTMPGPKTPEPAPRAVKLAERMLQKRIRTQLHGSPRPTIANSAPREGAQDGKAPATKTRR